MIKPMIFNFKEIKKFPDDNILSMIFDSNRLIDAIDKMEQHPYVDLTDARISILKAQVELHTEWKRRKDR